MKNSGIKKQGARIAFGIISLILFLWTAYLTVSFLNMALPRAFWLAPYLGLVVFDAGMLGWLFVYLYLAEGSTQRVVAIGLTLFNLIGVGLMTITEIVLGGQTLTTAPAGLGTAAIWGVGVWTFVNVAAIIIYHLSSPDARLAAAIQDEKDIVIDMALQNMVARREEDALALSEQIGAGMYNTLVGELMRDADGDGVPDLYERKANRGKRNRADSASKSTHDAPRQEPPQPATTTGQGDYTDAELMAAAEMLRRAKEHAGYANGNGEAVKTGRP